MSSTKKTTTQENKRGLSEMNVAIKVKKPFLKFWLNKKGKVIPDDVARGLNSDREKKELQQQEKEEAIFCNSWASSSVGRPLFR